jgi:ribosome-binding factor A
MAEAIREVVSQAILFQVSDPRVHGVTVLNVEVAGDLRSATAFVSVMGTPQEVESAMKGLRSATGFLQSLVAARLQTRFTPVLSFKRDVGIKKSVEMSKLIEETLAKDRIANPPKHGPSADEDHPAAALIVPHPELVDDDFDDEFDDDDDSDSELDADDEETP